MKSKKKIVLAYSGGLDTSIILKWLQENYNAEVICYTADVGQEIDKNKIITNAKKFGVKNIIIEDLKDVFVKDYVYPMIRGHAIYEGVYLLGTSIARPLIAKDQIRVIAIAPGSTDTPMLRLGAEQAATATKTPDDVLKQWAKDHPLGRLQTPQDMANLCMFLASDEASAITGTSITIDCGLTMQVAVALEQ